jgi:hypothetical protein
VFRGNARVWEGPLTLVTYKRESVSIQARDVMHYAYRLAQSRAYDNRYPNVDTVVEPGLPRAADRAGAPGGRGPTDQRAALPAQDQPGRGRRAPTRNTTQYQKTVFDDIDDMAANSGMDYTVVGRSIIIARHRHRPGADRDR